MRKHLFAASIAAVVLIPSIASARTRSEATCEQQSTTQVVATVAGAGVGGVLGNVVAGRGDKTLGTVIGAAAGALAGNQLAKPNRECKHAYGYYDERNRWHATGISSADARGYYDRNGGWVDGAPNGRYGDDNRWISSNASAGGYGNYLAGGEWVPASAEGYYDRDDQWVSVSPGAVGTRSARRADAYGYYDTQGQWHASSMAQGRATGYYDRNNAWIAGAPNGYYDERDQWVAGTASGHYDANGRWTAGVTIGHYDARGRWIAGQASGHRDAAGMWVADPQPGYYDNRRRWHAGETSGYYDSRGRWIATGAGTSDYGRERPAILSQIAALDQLLDTARSQRSLSNRQAAIYQRELYALRTSERSMTHDRRGNLSARDEVRLQVRIDSLNGRLRNAAR